MSEGEGDNVDGVDFQALLADPKRALRLLADPEKRSRFLLWSTEQAAKLDALEREHSDLVMLHDATLEHANEIEEELALKIDEVESLVSDLEVRNGFIRDIFGRYLNDDVVTTLLESPEALRLGGERRKVTILITDLRGFSGISERLDAENVVKLLNIYLGSMAQVIDAYGGSINEFIGDAILAVFGAPIFYEDAAQRAVACSLAMQIEMERVNIDCVAAGLPRLEMGIGVHTGEVIIGNIGSKRRTKYGLVGRNVNLASRVETYTVGGQVLISEATAAELGDSLETRGCFSVKPKGFASAITIYDVLAIDGRYQVRLPAFDDELEALPQAVPLRISVVDGKDAGGADDVGWIEALSGTTALLRTPVSLEPLVNVKLSFATQISADDVYAKVLGRLEDAPERVRIRFTPTPEGLVQALQRAADEQAQ